MEEGNADDAENGFACEVKEGSEFLSKADGRQLFFFYPASQRLCLTLLAGLVCDLMCGISNQETTGTFLIYPPRGYFLSSMP